MGNTQSFDYQQKLAFDSLNCQDLTKNAFLRKFNYGSLIFTFFVKCEADDFVIGLICNNYLTTNWKYTMHFVVEIVGENGEKIKNAGPMSHVFSFGENFVKKYNIGMVLPNRNQNFSVILYNSLGSVCGYTGIDDNEAAKLKLEKENDVLRKRLAELSGDYSGDNIKYYQENIKYIMEKFQLINANSETTAKLNEKTNELKTKTIKWNAEKAELLKKIANLEKDLKKLKDQRTEYNQNQASKIKVDKRLIQQIKSLNLMKKKVSFEDKVEVFEDESPNIIEVVSKSSAEITKVSRKTLNHRCPRLLYNSEFYQDQLIIEFSTKTFREMMNFFDKKSINSDDLETVEDLISIAKTYDIPDLKKFCEKKVASTLTVGNVSDKLCEFQKREMNELKIVAVNFAANNIIKLMSFAQWSDFCKNHEDILAEIVKRI